MSVKATEAVSPFDRPDLSARLIAPPLAWASAATRRAACLLLSWDNNARHMAAASAFVGDQPLLVERRDNARDLPHLGVAQRTGRGLGKRNTRHGTQGLFWGLFG
jgi:hypothetical protein